MSTELAITAVTATLRRLLEEGVAGKWGTDVLTGDLTKERFITSLPLHKVRETHAADNVINIFLFRTDVSAAWRNLTPPVAGKPSATGASPLALHLEYLISAYGEDDREEVAHFFLGQAMRILHDVALVPRQKLFDVLARAGVHKQVERITITPRPLTIEEISKLWSVFQTQYRVSAAYLVTVLLIDSSLPSATALPVLKRGLDDRGVTAVTSAPPTVDAVKPASGFRAVRLGEDLWIFGERLSAASVTAKVQHRLASKPHSLPVEALGATGLKVTLPAASVSGVPAKWPPGIYSFWLERPKPLDPMPDGTERVERTNEVPFMLAPSIVVSPTTLQPPAPSFELTLDVTPQVRSDQPVVVLFDDLQFVPKPIADPANADAPSVVKADVPGTAGLHRVRLRVDGIDSIPMRKAGDTFDFDPAQSVEVKP